MRVIFAILVAAFAIAAPLTVPSPAIASDGVLVALQTTANAALSGRVVDAQKNTPIEGVKVTAYPQGSTVAEASATTDSQGRFTLAGLRGGDYRLLFARQGYPKALAGGIGVKSHEHLVLISAFALESNPRAGQVRMVDPCGTLIQPGQVADVYVICGGH